jgi:hypothetical protein
MNLWSFVKDLTYYISNITVRLYCTFNIFCLAHTFNLVFLPAMWLINTYLHTYVIIWVSFKDIYYTTILFYSVLMLKFAHNS